MKISRRNFVKTGGLTALGLFGLAGSVKSVVGADNSSNLLVNSWQTSDSALFRKLIGTDFTVYGADFVITSRLNAVNDFPDTNPDRAARPKKFGQTNSECFYLDFQFPTEDFEQDIYQLYHPQIGQFDLLLVPGENRDGGKMMGAVINRI